MSEERIIELEVRIAYQDRLIEALDEVVRQFSSRVEHLERELTELKQTVARSLPEDPSSNDPPPHY